MDFQTLKLSDKQKITEIFKKTNYRTSDLSFANLFAWIGKFNSQISIIENNFFLRSCCSEQDSCYMFPIVEMPLIQAIELIKTDALERNLNFKIIGATREMFENINKICPEEYTFLPDRNAYDYIFLSQNLINLSGKKLQSKRNHINKFLKENQNWQYIRIESQKTLNDCKKMLEEWEYVENKRLDVSQQQEYHAVITMLNNFKELELKIGAIYLKEKVIAFSIGEALTEDTFVVHCEKAFSNINGAYTIINQQFIVNEAKNFKYVNREEDLGIENLRKSKMSYYPEILLEKGKIVLKK